MSNSDEMLVEQAQLGDLAAFEQLITRYETKVYTIAYRYIGNYNDASDLAQEAFIRVYRSINTFRGESSFLTWISRVVANVCKDELRRRAKENSISMDEMLEKGAVLQAHVSQRSLEEIILRKEWRSEVQQMINSLSEEYRMAVVMRDIQGYSYEEIATFMECSLGTVKSRISRARTQLKEKLLGVGDKLTDVACQGR